VSSLSFRRPAETDHARVVRLVHGWDGGRRLRRLAARSWFRHFTTTSWIVDEPDGRLVGFLIGYHAADDPEVAILHLIGVDQNRRRRGIGRQLVERFADEARAAGGRRLEAVAWPDDRAAVGFLTAVGFRPDAGPGSMRLYGTPAHPDFEGEGEDRVLLGRDL
jgi:ribosomal protein S18 acetylase RimI-like enzyme